MKRKGKKEMEIQLITLSNTVMETQSLYRQKLSLHNAPTKQEKQMPAQNSC